MCDYTLIWHQAAASVGNWRLAGTHLLPIVWDTRYYRLVRLACSNTGSKWGMSKYIYRTWENIWSVTVILKARVEILYLSFVTVNV